MCYNSKDRLKSRNKRKGFKLMEKQDFQFCDSVLNEFENKATNLIGIMQAIQQKYRYLSEECLTYIAKKLGIGQAKVYAVATFYENFSLEKKGKYVIRVCDGTACHVRKSQGVLNALNEELNLKDGKTTTDDMLFTLETVSCLGACGLAPVLTVNDVVHQQMTGEKAKELIKSLRESENV